MGVLEDKSFFREGAEFYNHPVRRCAELADCRVARY